MNRRPAGRWAGRIRSSVTPPAEKGRGGMIPLVRAIFRMGYTEIHAGNVARLVGYAVAARGLACLARGCRQPKAGGAARRHGAGPGTKAPRHARRSAPRPDAAGRP